MRIMKFECYLQGQVLETIPTDREIFVKTNDTIIKYYELECFGSHTITHVRNTNGGIVFNTDKTTQGLAGHVTITIMSEGRIKTKTYPVVV